VTQAVIVRPETIELVLKGFEDYLRAAAKRVREERTIKDHVLNIRRFLKRVNG